MKVQGTHTATANIQFQRLLIEDIVRLPKKTNIADFYSTSNVVVPEYKKKQIFWRNLFTGLTFGLTGLFIAHRNNLFNPPRRDMKKIIQNEEFITKVKNEVSKLINPETYKLVTRKFLSKLAKGGEGKPKEFSDEAAKILSNDKTFNQLYAKVEKRLSDDSSVSLQNGYAIDVIDKLSNVIERDLKKARIERTDYKEFVKQYPQTIFEPDGSTSRQLNETLYDVITNRLSSTVENFVSDEAINSHLSKAIK